VGLPKGFCTAGSRGHRTALLIRGAIYFMLVISPLIFAFFFGYSFSGSFLRSLALSCGLTGFAMLTLQPLISSRIGWIERPFGLDRLLRVHRRTGIIAAILVIVHPLLLTINSQSSRLLFSLQLPWYMNAAKLTLLLLILFASAALLRSRLHLPFQWWLRGHSSISPLIITGIFLHSYFTMVRFQPMPMKLLWFLLTGLGAGSWIWLNCRRLRGRLRSWEVTDVGRLTHNVWNIKLIPPDGKGGFHHLPGQFLFVTLLRGPGLPREEHPFTISSSPSENGSITISPKESGDFTKTLGRTETGHRAAVMAPFGRFSYLLHVKRSRLVFIAGGIGITPFISMLRYMRDRDPDRTVILVYANRTEDDIAFRDELDGIASSPDGPHLLIHNVLSSPAPSWKGDRGYVDEEKLRRYLENIDNAGFYICGPPPMMKAVLRTLTDMGVDRAEIHTEKFSL
jgi:predicted ferric reductase